MKNANMVWCIEYNNSISSGTSVSRWTFSQKVLSESPAWLLRMRVYAATATVAAIEMSHICSCSVRRGRTTGFGFGFGPCVFFSFLFTRWLFPFVIGEGMAHKAIARTNIRVAVLYCAGTEGAAWKDKGGVRNGVSADVRVP